MITCHFESYKVEVSFCSGLRLYIRSYCMNLKAIRCKVTISLVF